MKRNTFTVDVRFGAGVQSLLLGLAALVLLAAAFTLFRLHGEGQEATPGSLVALGIFLIAAPILLVKGLLAGWRALRSGPDKGAAVAGLLLNGVLLAAEIGVAVLAWSPLHDLL